MAINSPARQLSVDEAMTLLSKLAEHSPEAVKLFINSLDSLVQLIRIDLDSRLAGGAGELRIFAQPSDRLLAFLATSGAWEG